MRFFLYGFRLPLGFRGGVSVSPREMGRAFGQSPYPANVAPMATGIYVIRNGQGQFKIGISSDPRGRLAALQTGNPHRLSLAYVCYVKDGAYEVEQGAHDYLRPFAANGEWFHCSEEDAVYAVIQSARALGKNIKAPEDIPGLFAPIKPPFSLLKFAWLVVRIISGIIFGAAFVFIAHMLWLWLAAK